MVDNIEITRKPNEDEYEYIYRICSIKDNIGTWSEVAKILNAQLGYEYTESKYRKQYQSFQKMFEANQAQLQSDVYMNDIIERTREMNRERMKLQTEKLEYNRWLRSHSRDELILERITDEIRKLPQLEYDDYCGEFDFDEIENTREQTAVLCFGDDHFGAEFEIKGLHGEVINAYNPEIYLRRMNTIMVTTLEKVLTRGLKKVKIYSLGDEIDGILRVSQLSKLRYGVIESTIRYAECLCTFLNELSAIVDVEFHMTEGNHSELRMLGQPKGTFSDENMSRVIKQFIKIRMENNPKFTLVENDTGLIFDNIYGMNVLGIHGEVKDLATAIKNFSTMYNTQIDILIGAHKHHYEAETIGVNKDVISIPSIMGSDLYSMKIGKTSNAGATLLIIEEGKGVTEQHNIKF